MAKNRLPSTQAVRFLKSKKIPFTTHFYRYIEHGGTTEAAKQLSIDEHKIIKTLIFQDDSGNPLIVLINGDYDVSLKELARITGVKKYILPHADKAEKYTGYRVGGTSPFGIKTKMPVFAQEDIFILDTIVINGGQRGFLVEISPDCLIEYLGAKKVDVGIKV